MLDTAQQVIDESVRDLVNQSKQSKTYKSEDIIGELMQVEQLEEQIKQILKAYGPELDGDHKSRRLAIESQCKTLQDQIT